MFCQLKHIDALGSSCHSCQRCMLNQGVYAVSSHTDIYLYTNSIGSNVSNAFALQRCPPGTHVDVIQLFFQSKTALKPLTGIYMYCNNTPWTVMRYLSRADTADLLTTVIVSKTLSLSLCKIRIKLPIRSDHRLGNTLACFWYIKKFELDFAHNRWFYCLVRTQASVDVHVDPITLMTP